MKSKNSLHKNTDSSDNIPISVLLTRPSFPEVVEPPPSRNYVLKRVFYLSLQAVFNAIIIGFIAKIMIALIDFVTNLCFYGKISFAESAPSTHLLGLWVILIPVIGGVIVGLMARFGSPGIRGHGIPEAMEQILLNESKIKPIITFLKPLSAAFAIGTGGPFGAEGPIISGGGAFGSFAGQIMKINANERKIMLAAGACAGMAAIFGCPISATLLGIELLLFEFSPRSIIPVALSCVTGGIMRFLLFGYTPIFAMPAIPDPTNIATITYTILGVIIGVAAAYASKAVYFLEDLYGKLPVHWMWWPAIGAIVVGIIGYFAPKTMGVGYSNISLLLTGATPLYLLFSFCILKFLSWSVSLASGTSGGTLAPLFTIGGGLGALLGLVTLHYFPGSQINIATAALIGMAAMFAGASRALLTSIVFAMETTGQIHGMLPLIGACTAAYFVSFFLMKGSIMTEKMERHGLTPPETFQPDILEQVLAKNAMDTGVSVLSSENTIKDAREWIKKNVSEEEYVSFIVADHNKSIAGLVQRVDIFSKQHDDNAPISSLIKGRIAYIYPNNQLSLAVDIMDKYDIDILPVVKRDESHEVLGAISRKAIFSIYHKRRNADEIYRQTISLRQRSMRMIVRGKQLFSRDRTQDNL
ncbi:MAG: chloride channel protein [Chitinophagaceae bacterium]|nr:MAG: chloride channel protein [Chitinophagaceae bacterium]